MRIIALSVSIAWIGFAGLDAARADVTVTDAYFNEILQCSRSERTQSERTCVYIFKQCVGYHGTGRAYSDVEKQNVGLRITCAQHDDGTCPGATFCARDVSVASEGIPFRNGEAWCGGDADAHPGCHWVNRQSQQR